MTHALLPLLGLSLLSLAAADDDRPIVRGTYYTSEKLGFEMWIPRGLSRVKRARDERLEAMFRGPLLAGGAYEVTIRKAAGSSPQGLVDGLKAEFSRAQPRHTLRIFEDVAAGPWRAIIAVFSNLSGDYAQVAQVTAGIPVGDGLLVEITMMVRVEKLERAIVEMRWMLGTMKAAGERGLDPFLDGRHVVKRSGLSFRPPGDFEMVPAEGDQTLAAAVQKGTGTRLTIERAASQADARPGETLGRHVRESRPWQIETGAETAAKRKLCAAYYQAKDGKRGMAFVGCEFGGTHFFCVKVAGPREDRERHLRVAELVAMSLEHVDVEKVRGEVEAAAAALDEALKKRRAGDAATHARFLARYAFMDVARHLLSRALPALQDVQTQVAVVNALGRAGEADVLPALLGCLKDYRTKKKPRVVTALLDALGRVRGPQAVSLLLRHARHNDAAQAGTAIRSLGRYEVKKRQILRELVRLMARLEERAARSRRIRERDHWLKLRPVFQAALQRLTGVRFRTTAEAQAWLRES